MGGFVNNLKRLGGAYLPPAVPARTPPFLPPGTSTAPGMRPPTPNLPPQSPGDAQDDDGTPTPAPPIQQAAPRPLPPPQTQQPAPVRPPPVMPQPDETDNATPQAPPDQGPPPASAPPPVQNRSMPPSWSEQAAKTDQARKDLEAVQRPIAPEPKGVRKYLGAFVNGGALGVAKEALQPGAAYAQKKYAVDRENAGNKYTLEERGLQDAVTEGNRQSQIEDRTEKQAIARERIKEVRSKTYQQDVKTRIGKREEDATYQAESAPRREGTEYIPNDEKPGFGWVVPAAYSPLPKELAPFLPGHKEGQVVPYSKIKQATKDYNASQLVTQKSDLKPDRESPNQWMADSLNPDPSISGPAKQKLKLAEAHQKAGRTIVNAGGGDVLTPDDFKRAGAEYAITGVMPALGNGSGPVKQRLIHEKMEFARNSGLSPRDMALAGAAFKGDSKSLAAFQTQRDQIVSFEQTAQKNIDLFLNTASRIRDTGSPWMNTPLRLVDTKLIGSANMAAFNAARAVATNEAAKVTAGGGLGGVLSDAAKKEVKDYNPENATFAQTLAVARIIKQDMANRHESMDNTLGVIRDRIGTFGAQPQQQQENTQPAVQPPPAPGTVKGGYRFKGGNPNDRNSWEPVSAPPGR